MNEIKFYDDDFNESIVNLDDYEMITAIDDTIDSTEVYTEMYDYEKSEYYVMKGYHLANTVCYWIPKRLKLSDILSEMDFSYKIKDGLFSLVDVTGANLGDIEALEYEVNDDLAEQVLDSLDTYKEDYFLYDLRMRIAHRVDVALTSDDYLEDYVKAMKKDSKHFADDIKLVKCFIEPKRLDIRDIKEKYNEYIKMH